MYHLYGMYVVYELHSYVNIFTVNVYFMLIQYRVFTLDPVNFALPKMTEFVNYLHNNSMKYGMFVHCQIFLLYNGL